MKNFLILVLALLLPITAFAGNGSSNVSAVAGAGISTAQAPTAYYPIPTNATIIYLHCGSPGTAAGSSSYPCRKAGVAYQITSNKILTCFAGSVWSDVGGVQFQMMHATATFADNTATPTGAVYEGGSANANARGWNNSTAITLYQHMQTPPYEWPSNATGFWPGINIVGGAGKVDADFVCYEH